MLHLLLNILVVDFYRAHVASGASTPFAVIGQQRNDNPVADGKQESYSLHRLLRFMVSDAPRAVRLRQSCPFFAVLRDKERLQLEGSSR